MLLHDLSSFSHRAILPLTFVLTLPQSKRPCHQLHICPERPILVFEERLFLNPIHRNQAIPILRLRPVLNELAEPPFSTDTLKEPTKFPEHANSNIAGDHSKTDRRVALVFTPPIESSRCFVLKDFPPPYLSMPGLSLPCFPLLCPPLP